MAPFNLSTRYVILFSISLPPPVSEQHIIHRVLVNVIPRACTSHVSNLLTAVQFSTLRNLQRLPISLTTWILNLILVNETVYILGGTQSKVKIGPVCPWNHGMRPKKL